MGGHGQLQSVTTDSFRAFQLVNLLLAYPQQKT